MPPEIPALRTDILPLKDLQSLLPLLIEDLSLGRAQIAVDQIRSQLENRQSNRILLIGVSQPHDCQPLAAVIAIESIEQPSGTSGKCATIVHAGAVGQPLINQPGPLAKQLIAALSASLDQELARRGVTFLQWATDPIDGPTSSHAEAPASWCHGFGFQSIATLDYLSCAIDTTSARDFGQACEPPQIRLALLDRSGSGESMERFRQLVERTYQQTHDCPRLSQFRTTAQTLAAYQTTASFSPSLWFNIYEAGGEVGGSQPIGCLILATHPASTDQVADSPIVEIVYMGLVPETRGKRFGRHLVAHAIDEAQRIGADRIILAVDQQNGPARDVYDSAGFQAMFQETVWVKSVPFT